MCLSVRRSQTTNSPRLLRNLTGNPTCNFHSIGQKKGRNPGRSPETSVFVSAVSCRRSIGNKDRKPKSRPTCHLLRTMAFGLPSGTALRTSAQASPQQNASNANQPALRFHKSAYAQVSQISLRSGFTNLRADRHASHYA